MASIVGTLTSIFLLFFICTIRSSAEFDNDNRISRLEKLVESQNTEILSLRNEVAELGVLKNKIRILEKENLVLKFLKDNVKTHRAEMQDMKKLIRRQQLKTQYLETQLRISSLRLNNICNPCYSTTTPTLGNNEINQETRKEDIGSPEKDPAVTLRRQDRMLISSPVVDALQKIAFYAYLSHGEVDPGHHHIIVFDNELTNSGNGYNKYTGTFLVPIEGLYVFSHTIVVERGHQMPTELVVNGNAVGAVAADSYSDSHYPAAST
ncbi:uncharacterized protein LOC134699511 [Mytilus trossulus]|uniref:uncharacterized protein LOC134699511 n=1 Tax=Mytilus trossulus TaxID=6551 RepID=UPI003006D8C0